MPKNEAPRVTIGAEPEVGDRHHEDMDEFETAQAWATLERAAAIKSDQQLMERIKFYVARKKEKQDRYERLAREAL